ncbi:catalytic activity protein [[Candida] boidinii]|nr:catalytic activity protein [[Candida] boidinii]OWB70880.1 catalytic activity protein [[Candida] boidinii]OWB80941.1 catalytic activity protein [[Candida] boidinii]
MSKWGFRGTVHGHHSENTVQLPLKGKYKDNSDATATIPFAELINKYVPEFRDGNRFNLNPILFNGTLQTMYPTKADYSKVYKVHYGRELIQLKPSEDLPLLQEGQITCDYVINPFDKDEEEFKANSAKTLPEGFPRLHARTRYLSDEELSKVDEIWKSNDDPIVVIQHGLNGGSYEPAIRAVTEELFKNNYNIVCVNSRGCCRTPLSTPYPLTGANTEDMRFVIRRLHKDYPKKKIFLLGFSFGALISTNYLCEEGKNSLITAAFTIGCPWDLLLSTLHVEKSWSGRYLFAPAILYFLMNYIKVNLKTVATSSNPDFSEENYYKNKKHFKLPIQFDDVYTSRSAGFQSAPIYYRNASPAARIHDLETPLLALNSIDDPLVSDDLPIWESKKQPYLYVAATDLGGHLAYIQNNGDFWFKKPISEYFNAFRDQIEDHTRPITDYKPALNIFRLKEKAYKDNHEYVDMRLEK